jgi:hypothetical protein
MGYPWVSAQLLEDPVVVSLGEKMLVEVAEAE